MPVMKLAAKDEKKFKKWLRAIRSAQRATALFIPTDDKKTQGKNTAASKATKKIKEFFGI